MSVLKMSSTRLPLIIILGATGTGKTKLSLQLAEKLKSEIISADSMQLYKGLSVVSAKATVQEQSRVPHHIIDILEPHQFYTVVDFRNKALSIIDRLVSQNKIPIVVGGTNYYIESILWKVLVENVNLTPSELVSERDVQNKALLKKRKLDNQITSDAGEAAASNERVETGGVDKFNEKGDEAAGGSAARDEYYGDDCKLSNEVLYAKLKEVDPERAHSIHPNNRRRILRDVEIEME